MCFHLLKLLYVDEEPTSKSTRFLTPDDQRQSNMEASRLKQMKISHDKKPNSNKMNGCYGSRGVSNATRLNTVKDIQRWNLMLFQEKIVLESIGQRTLRYVIQNKSA
jgi:hypothetical protein